MIAKYSLVCKSLHQGASTSQAGADWLAAAAIIYLAAPLLVFAAMWLRLPIALLATASCILALTGWRSAAPTRLGPPLIVWCVALAAAATVASGTSPLINGIPCLDLEKHRWLMQTLTERAWPPTLESGSSVLRYSLGLYLIPAAAAKLSPSLRDWFMLGWAGIGLVIFLMLVAGQTNRRILVGAFPLVALLFAGLEPIATGARWSGVMSAWSRDPWGWMIASNSFSYNWTPQHSVAAWIAAALIYRYRDSPWFFANSGILLVVALFWSPLVGIAVGLLLAPLALRHWRSVASYQNVAATIPGAIVFFYLSADTGGIPAHFIGHLSSAAFWTSYVELAVIAFGVYATLAFAIGARSYALFVATALLLTFPFVVLGTSNDFQMRASIVPATIVMLACLDALSASGRLPLRVLLAAALALGASAGAAEFWRAWHSPALCGSFDETLRRYPEIHAQYLAATNRLAWLFRLPN